MPGAATQAGFVRHGLGVLACGVVDSGDGWLACECGVAAVVVVAVEEVCQGCGALVVAGVGPAVT